MNKYRYVDRDTSFFDEMCCDQARAWIQKHDVDGTLVEAITEHAPDYIYDGQVLIFTLLIDLGI